jgi:hypothetical protein
MHGKNLLRVSIFVLFASLVFASPAQSVAQGLDSTQARNAPTSLLFITGDAAHPVAVSIARIQTMPQIEIKVISAETKDTETYSGVLLKDLLNRADVSAGKLTIVAVDKDGSSVTLSSAEADSVFSDQGKIIVANRLNEQSLDATEGPLMLVISGDAESAHLVRNLTRIQVSTVK